MGPEQVIRVKLESELNDLVGKRLGDVLDILRANRLHDSSCAVLKPVCDYGEKHSGEACLVNHPAPECDCWLSKGEADG